MLASFLRYPSWLLGCWVQNSNGMFQIWGWHESDPWDEAILLGWGRMKQTCPPPYRTTVLPERLVTPVSGKYAHCFRLAYTLVLGY